MALGTAQCGLLNWSSGEALSGAGQADNAFAALKNFEESVSREEAKAQAFDQLASVTGQDQVLEAEFTELKVWLQ